MPGSSSGRYTTISHISLPLLKDTWPWVQLLCADRALCSMPVKLGHSDQDEFTAETCSVRSVPRCIKPEDVTIERSSKLLAKLEFDLRTLTSIREGEVFTLLDMGSVPVVQMSF